MWVQVWCQDQTNLFAVGNEAFCQITLDICSLMSVSLELFRPFVALPLLTPLVTSLTYCYLIVKFISKFCLNVRRAAGKFLTSLMQDGSMNEAALCSQQLDRIYGPLREQVAQSLKRQDNVLRQLKVARLARELLIN